jgi:phosphoribosylanthranilate isomerase
MSLWVKICGLTTELGVRTAIEAGADAVGFVFAPSRRQITAQRAAEIAQGVRVARVAVMQHPSQALLDEVWSVFRPDVLQTDVEDFERLQVPTELRVLPVLRAGRAVPDELPGRVLFEGPVSGAGAVADWERARQVAARTELVLAGGLDAMNVAAAIAAVHPFGVDVSSGVESAPGEKDPEKIRSFVRSARAAAGGAKR